MIPDQSIALGFDYGERRIGVAVGQTLTFTANPVAIVPVRGGRPDWERIETLVRQYEPAVLVVGLPLHADGSEHELSPRIRKFGRQLQARFRLPVRLVDERLSSHEAAQRCRETGADDLDAVAAQVILETWLNDRSMTAGVP